MSTLKNMEPGSEYTKKCTGESATKNVLASIPKNVPLSMHKTGDECT